MDTLVQAKKLATTLLLVACGCLVGASKSANAQASGAATTAEVVLGKPFSAVQSSRQVHFDRDGRQTVLQDMGHLLLARDASGRITMRGADIFGKNCDMPDFGTLPPCDYWSQFIFDPVAGEMWHWGNGPLGLSSQVIRISLSADQIREAERLTSVMKVTSSPAVSEEGTFVQQLGERTVDGIPAVGVRTIVSNSASASAPTLTFHEVWTSPSMRLVVKVVDGDTTGNLTTTGLEHITLNPDARLFEPIPHEVLSYKEAGTEDDFAGLRKWFVQP